MRNYIYFLRAKNNLHIQLMNELLTISSKLPSLSARKAYLFIQFCSAVLLNEKLQYNCNINCGGNKNSIMSWQMVCHQGTTRLTHQAFPKNQVMMVWSKIWNLIKLRHVKRPVLNLIGFKLKTAAENKSWMHAKYLWCLSWSSVSIDCQGQGKNVTWKYDNVTIWHFDDD